MSSLIKGVPDGSLKPSRDGTWATHYLRRMKYMPDVTPLAAIYLIAFFYKAK